MEWKKGTLQSLLQLNKEKMIFLFCAGLLLFVLALPSEKEEKTEPADLLVSYGNTDNVEACRLYGIHHFLCGYGIAPGGFTGKTRAACSVKGVA